MNDIFTDQNEIIELLESQEYPNALPKIDQYKENHCKDSFYYLALSDAQMGLEEYSQVILTMQEAIASGLEDEAIYERMADAYIYTEQYDLSLHYLDQCSLEEDTPDNLHLHFVKAHALLGLGRFQEALNSFEDILLEVQDDPTLYYAALCWLELGNLERAREYFMKMEEDELLRDDIVSFLTDDGLVGEANPLLLFSALEPERAALADAYAMSYYFWKNRLNDARNTAWSMRQSGYSSLAILTVAQFYALSGDMEESLKTLEEVVGAPYVKRLNKGVETNVRTNALAMLNLSEEDNRFYLKDMYQNTGDWTDSCLNLINTAIDFEYFDLAQEWIDAGISDHAQDIEKNRLAIMNITLKILIGQMDEADKLLEAYPNKEEKVWKKMYLTKAFGTDQVTDEIIDKAKQLLPDGDMACELFAYYYRIDDEASAFDVLYSVYDVMRNLSGDEADEIEGIDRVMEMVAATTEELMGEEIDF